MFILQPQVSPCFSPPLPLHWFASIVSDCKTVSIFVHSAWAVQYCRDNCILDCNNSGHTRNKCVFGRSLHKRLQLMHWQTLLDQRLCSDKSVYDYLVHVLVLNPPTCWASPVISSEVITCTTEVSFTCLPQNQTYFTSIISSKMLIYKRHSVNSRWNYELECFATVRLFCFRNGCWVLFMNYMVLLIFN